MSVIEETKYTLEGYCSKCGDCCRFLYCVEPMSKWTFLLMKLFYPEYRRFRVIGKDENGLILSCTLIREDGLCPDYENRPDICREFPNPEKVYSGGVLYKRCSYRLIPEKSFDVFLSVEEKRQEQSSSKP